MSAPMKKHLTNSPIELVLFDADKKKILTLKDIPPKVFNYLKSLEKTKEKINKKNGVIKAEDHPVFKALDKKYGKVGVIIQGYRGRDDLTQAQLAKKLLISTKQLSAFENGKQEVDLETAKKFAKIFRSKKERFLKK